VHDLAIAKLAADREKDLEFVQTLAGRGYVKTEVLGERLRETDMTVDRRSRIQAVIERLS
jgi:hypothetical protein